MSESTPLLCPTCGGNIAVKVTTSRIVTFGSDDGSWVGLYATGPRQYWEHPHDDDSSECDDINCSEPDCTYKHNYDPQKNRELLEDPTVDKTFAYDWDYSSEEDESIEKVTRFYCTHWNCNWSMTVTAQMNSHLSMDNVG